VFATCQHGRFCWTAFLSTTLPETRTSVSLLNVISMLKRCPVKIRPSLWNRIDKLGSVLYLFASFNNSLLWPASSTVHIWKQEKQNRQLLTSFRTLFVQVTTDRMTWEKFYQRVRRPIPGPPGFWGRRRNLHGLFVYRVNQNIDEAVTMVRFINWLIVILATGIH